MSVQAWTFVTIGLSFALYIGIAVWSRVRTTEGFYVAGRGVSAVANGMATAADWMSAASFLSMAGLIAFMGFDGAVYLMGWTGGYVLLALLLAPFLRRFGWYTVPDFVAALSGDVRGIRVGVPWAFLEKGVKPDVLKAFKEAVAVLEKIGCKIADVALPHAPHAIATYYMVATAEASSNLARYDGVRYGLRAPAHDLKKMYGETRDRGFGPEVKRRIILGTFVLSSGYYDAYYGSAQKVRTLITQDFAKAFENFDVLISPTTPTTAFKIGERANDPIAMYKADLCTIPANLAGTPAMSVPSGLSDEDGLPVGLQIMAPALQDHRMYRVAAAYEAARGAFGGASL